MICFTARYLTIKPEELSLTVGAWSLRYHSFLSLSPPGLGTDHEMSLQSDKYSPKFDHQWQNKELIDFKIVDYICFNVYHA